ncbi:class I SAM-dependent methyltransferase [Cupriavidus necator]|uniref:Methyltransferase domain-containing protein n=1 Tax=Cupriavidus pinatubonensis (strain JMP 134 / LMG 1197) TaxID=264198 RepID=Q473F2_CUPPJ|nr:class I SAM-dependent methyltransferase [Cupriavidus necator]
MLAHAPTGAPSDWVTRWAHLVRPSGRVLDLACGSGRHARWFAQRGYAVVGVDRDAEAVAALPSPIAGRVEDLEQGTWPLSGEAAFDAIVVTNYLHRPLWAHLAAALAPGGVLLYETFASGNKTVGKPSRPDFLLNPGELLEVAHTHGLRVIGYEDGVLEVPRTAFVQRLCAVREVVHTAGGNVPPRYPLPT